MLKKIGPRGLPPRGPLPFLGMQRGFAIACSSHIQAIGMKYSITTCGGAIEILGTRE